MQPLVVAYIEALRSQRVDEAVCVALLGQARVTRLDPLLLLLAHLPASREAEERCVKRWGAACRQSERRGRAGVHGEEVGRGSAATRVLMRVTTGRALL